MKKRQDKYNEQELLKKGEREGKKAREVEKERERRRERGERERERGREREKERVREKGPAKPFQMIAASLNKTNRNKNTYSLQAKTTTTKR